MSHTCDQRDETPRRRPGMSMGAGAPCVRRALRPWAALGVLWVAAVFAVGCQEEYLPDNPEGAYMLWRQALLSGDTAGVYELLDEDTHKVLDERVEVMRVMSEDIVRYLPQVDQKLAREQTGVVLLRKHDMETGADLFEVLFEPDKLEVTPSVEVGTEISEMTLNEAGDEAVIVVYSSQQFLMRRGQDGRWRVSSWRTLCLERTQWILDNRDALEQTVQDLINEEKEEVDAAIKFLLAEDKRRQAATREN